MGGKWRAHILLVFVMASTSDGLGAGAKKRYAPTASALRGCGCVGLATRGMLLMLRWEIEWRG